MKFRMNIVPAVCAAIPVYMLELRPPNQNSKAPLADDDCVKLRDIVVCPDLFNPPADVNVFRVWLYKLKPKNFNLKSPNLKSET